MKRLISIIVILIVLAGMSVGGVVYIKYAGDKMTTSLEQISVELKKDTIDQEKITSLCNDICTEWEKHNNIIGAFTIHDTIDTIEHSFVTLRAYATEGHIISIAPLIEEIKFHLYHLYEQELPKIKNIL